MGANSYRSFFLRLYLSLLFLIKCQILFSQVIFDTPGTYTWTVPPCVTQITVQVWGGGGGGGSVWSRFNSVSGTGSNCETGDEICASGGGGGGGGFAQRTYTVVPCHVYTIVVGAGGTTSVNPSGENRANNGTNGGNSTFSGPATAGPGTLTGFGGTGGGAANIIRSCNFGCSFNHNGENGSGGAGGGGANGTVTYLGGSGATGAHSASTNDRSGGGGGGAGSNANGGNGGLITAGLGGNGSGGNGGAGINQTYGNGYFGTNGNPGFVIGGGGGGACSHNRNSCNSTGNNHRSQTGGNGQRGEVRITYTAVSLIEPTFTTIAPICSGGTLAPLPTTSNNGINGSWSPALNNTATTTYIFTPVCASCADTASLTIVVNLPVTPSFAPYPSYCSGASIPSLPTTSTNGVNGTWSPAINDTVTTNYTFTPIAGSCAITTTLTITINSPPVINNQPQSTAICANGSATLSITASGGPYQWQYNQGGTWQNVANGTPSGFSYSNAITNSLGITTANALCAMPAQFRVLVGSSSCPIVSNTANVTVLSATRITPFGPQCTGSQLNFEACPAGATYSWIVIPPSGTSATPTSGNGQTFSFTPTNNSGSNQTFVINSTVSIAGLTCPQSFTPNIISSPAATVNSPTACFGNNATVTATPNPAGAYNYAWTVPAGASNPGNASSFTTSVAGNYSVIVSTTGSPSCPSSSANGIVTITPQPPAPALACYQTATFNTSSCQWDVTGTQPVQPTLACYQTATFNTSSCQWDVTGTQPVQPTLACYQTATFNTSSCQWDLTGTQPVQPTLACYQTATFNTSSCQWDVTGTQPVQPSLACYETANFNTSSCQWDVTGTQPVQPTLACYQTATFNTNSCQWDVTGTQPVQPSLACYETENFNTSSCQWDVTGTQPVQPTLACYQTAAFNTSSCQWGVTGTQPIQPTLACYQTATFNTSSCQWDVTVTQPAADTFSVTICDGQSYFAGGGLQTSTGIYSDTLIAANGCDSIINTNLNVIVFNVEAITETDTVQIGDSTELEAFSDSLIITYQWQPSSGLDCNNCPDPIATPTVTTNYFVIATDLYGCLDSSFVTVHVLNDTSSYNPGDDTTQVCQKVFYVPNAFSPNGDGYNDVFYVYGKGISQMNLQIFNRWGELVFKTDDINLGWDGTYKGKLQVPGVYVYHLKAIFCDGSTTIPNGQNKGSVTLIR
jgi:gliding motility-associated-like protein